MICNHFAPVGEAGMADGENPKQGSDPDKEHLQDAHASKAVEDGIQDETTPFFSDEEIQGRDKNNTKVDHIR